MLRAPYESEIIILPFSSPEESLPPQTEYNELEIVAEAFRGVLADGQLQQQPYNRQTAIDFVRIYAVTQGGLGATDTRVAYFEGARRARRRLPISLLLT